jgi:hypothetical protein
MTLDELITEARASGDSSLDQLNAACSIGAHLSELSDHLVGHFVDQARRDGASWAAIGQAMGVTKQAVQKRFTAGDPDLSRFTNRATVVVLKAQNDARYRGHDEVSTLHLLVGVLAEWDGYAGMAIEALGVTKDRLLSAVEGALPAGGEPHLEHSPYAASAKKALALAGREATRLGHGYVGTEHLLLGLLDLWDDPATHLLGELGVDKEHAERWLVDALATATAG